MGTKPLLHCLLATTVACLSLSIDTSAQDNHGEGKIDVLMNRYDMQRTGANLSETNLNVINVNAQSFGKLWTYNVGGQVYAQPLLVTNVTIPGVGIRDVLLIADMHNDVYCFDANDQSKAATPYWKVSYGHSVPLPGSPIQIGEDGYSDVRIEIGIMSTPAIDKSTNTIYFVTKSQVGSQITDSLHALDLSTGQPKFGGSELIAASVPGTGEGGSIVSFNSRFSNQRSALLLYNGIVYVAYGSYGDTPPYHGWIFGYNASNITRQSVVYNMNPDGQYDGIWMSGAGPSVDTSGNLYVITGTGLSGVRDYGEAFMKLSPDLSHNTLSLVDYFVPYNQQQLSRDDLDLSSGALLIPNSHMIAGAGKAGTLYLVDGDNMGKFNSGTDASADQILQEFQAFNGQLLGTGIYWADSANNPNTALTFWWSAQDNLKAYRINTLTKQFNTTPVAKGPGNEWPDLPGGIMALSANGSTSGSAVLWATYPNDNANLFTVSGTLHAYNAATLAEIWNSDQVRNRDSVGSFAKFNPPVIANGKVYLPTFSGTVNVYGLFTALPVVYESFTAIRQGSSAHLRWTTSNENNNAYFNVLHSTDGATFTKIGTVQGRGNANVAQDYSFDDASPENGTDYYRLEQVDLDGKSTYSMIVSVDMDLIGNVYLQLYPNPAHDHITLICNGLKAGDKIGFELYNSAGSLVYHQEATLGGDLRITVQRTAVMYTGVYFIRVTLPSGEQREERVIWGS
jgi:hypothetical protein